MIELSGKQKSLLRGLGQKLTHLATVGKAGVSPELADNLGRLLKVHELIKVRIPAGDSAARDKTAHDLADASASAMVGLIGRVVLLYKPNPELEESLARKVDSLK